ncbi:MAG: D-glycero-beta-D-manno-heptose 1,7-bisphosphate 7-phosphatase [Bacilli bacterium]|nr:D-glycero-beta-D-manno-heptose 1,7-bisphosphate 7-phosphatase [Bacilli bacterium]
MKAVIQAGGKGTRVSSLTGDVIPKPMLEISGYPILYHQIMNLKKSGITDITLIVGHLGEVIKDYFKDGSSLGVNINYVTEDPEKPLGTAGALYYLKDRINDDFIFLLADVFIDIDFKRMEQFHKDNNAAATLMTHPNAHPFDSDLVVVDGNNKVLKFDHKTNDRTKYFYHNLVNAGVMIFSKDTLDLITEEKKYSYEKDIIEPLIAEGKVYSYKSSEYAKDMGTPERYAMVQDEYNRGVHIKKNLSNKQKCIFLDRDGTINKHIGFMRNIDDFELIPGVAEAIKEINNSDYLCIVVTNQPVIARGEVTEEELNEVHMKMEKLLGDEGAYINGLYYCPHHPDKGFEGERPELKFDCDCRKPKIGMLLQAVKDFNIDLSQSIIIGDSTLDIKMAENAGGITSVLVKTGQGGKDNKYVVNPTYVCEDLKEAVETVLNRENGRKRQ